MLFDRTSETDKWVKQYAVADHIFSHWFDSLKLKSEFGKKQKEPREESWWSANKWSLQFLLS